MKISQWFPWILALGVATVATPLAAEQPGKALDPSPPSQPVKLIFIHHSVGENWLADDNGGLGQALMNNNYFVSDTNYGWDPDGIGDSTDIGHWWTWFRGSRSTTYMNALYDESEQHSWYSRPAADPGGENEIVMFKSCFPNSDLGGQPNDPPTAGGNPLRGRDAWSAQHTVGNAKGIYNDLLQYFATRRDKLFVAVTAPPLIDGTHAANARAFNTWLVEEWLDDYPHDNVAVFDFFNALTSNGGSWNANDRGWATGNHHRYQGGVIEYVTDQGGDTAAYPDGGDDDHPSAAGGRKATGEFVSLLNVFYHQWQAGEGPDPPIPPGPPDPEATLYLNNDRFAVTVSWEDTQGNTGSGQPVELTDETGYFWFFDDANIELVVKVLDACYDPYNRFWVFAAGLTNVEVLLRVTDTETQEYRDYFNPLNQAFQPVLDTGAFAGCDE
ncbi:MAG: hypothetical protein GY856_45380 [bacterium]|nr:hypothetical protein [bacterium]